MFIVFDTEAKDVADNFIDNGISYVAYYRSDTAILDGYFEQDLAKFIELLEQADEIIGYNIIGYDFPVLERYGKVNLAGKKIVDLYKIIADQNDVYLKLDNIATTTLGNSKIAHGLDAVRFYKQGQLDKLKEYCDSDVQLTTDIYKFIKENGYIFYTDGLGQKVKLEVKLDTSDINQDTGLFPGAEDAGLGLF